MKGSSASGAWVIDSRLKITQLDAGSQNATLEPERSDAVQTPRARPKPWRWNNRLLFRASFVQALLETFGLALGLQSLAWLWARTGAAAPGPEFLAFLAEHSLWVLGVLLLRRSSHHTILGSGLLAQLWRFARAPIFGALTGAGFALLIWQSSQVLPISRSFYEFQALAVPDASRALEAMPALALSTMLRFVFAYAFRAVWLEGRRVLRWRLTALALGGGVLASGVVAVLLIAHFFVFH